MTIILSIMARNIVGPRVREARKIAKPPVSQVDLAARVQVIGLKLEQSAISKIENGRRPVADFEVVALAQALAVTVSWLLGQDCM